MLAGLLGASGQLTRLTTTFGERDAISAALRKWKGAAEQDQHMSYWTKDGRVNLLAGEVKPPPGK